MIFHHEISPHDAILRSVAADELDASKSYWPGWQSTISSRGGSASDRDRFAPTMDSDEEGGIPHPSFDKGYKNN